MFWRLRKRSHLGQVPSRSYRRCQCIHICWSFWAGSGCALCVKSGDTSGFLRYFADFSAAVWLRSPIFYFRKVVDYLPSPCRRPAEVRYRFAKTLYSKQMARTKLSIWGEGSWRSKSLSLRLERLNLYARTASNFSGSSPKCV